MFSQSKMKHIYFVFVSPVMFQATALSELLHTISGHILLK
jgi:hypothetical protein